MIKDFITNTSLLNSASIFLTLLFGILTIFFYLKSRNKKSIVFYSRTINLINDDTEKFDSVEITYQGEKINKLALTQISFWNPGNSVLESSDIAPRNPLKIVASEDSLMYEIEVVSTTHDAQNIMLSPLPIENGKHSQNEMYLNFDFIEPGGGGVVQVLHTGSDKSLNIIGIVKGSGKTKHVVDYIDMLDPKLDFIKKWSRKRRKNFLALMLFIAPVVSVLPLIFTKFNDIPKVIDSPWAIALIFAIYWFAAYLAFRTKIPRGIEPFSK